jgi:hypothetical protein
MGRDVQVDYQRYSNLIAHEIKPTHRAFVPRAESDTALQVERATVYPDALLRPDRLDDILSAVERPIRIVAEGNLPALAVVDQSGQHRPVYRPLLIYGWLQAFKLLYEVLPRDQFGRWDEALRVWCDLLEAELGDARVSDAGTPASHGHVVTEAAWSALALFAAGRLLVRDAWTDLASDTFGRLTRGQTDQGTFLTPGSSDNPETWWYHELVLLHAAASYAVQGEDRTVAAAVARSTEHHLRETQPDHATSQPWALFPFVWNPNTRPLADQVLHSATVTRPAGGDGVALILLADALYCLRLFQPPSR